MRKVYLQNGSKATAFKLQHMYRTLKAVASLPFCAVLVAACFFIGNSGALAQAVDLQKCQEVQPANWTRSSQPRAILILFPGAPTVSEQTVEIILSGNFLAQPPTSDICGCGVIYLLPEVSHRQHVGECF